MGGGGRLMLHVCSVLWLCVCDLKEITSAFFLFLSFFFILERGRVRGKRKREGDINLFYLFMYLFIASFMRCDQGLNPQPWCVGMML